MIVEPGTGMKALIMRDISRTLATLTMIDEMPMTGAVISREKSFRVRKSGTAQGLEVFPGDQHDEFARNQFKTDDTQQMVQSNLNAT